MLEDVEIMAAEAGRRMADTRKGHENDYDKNVQREPQRSVANIVYIDWHQHATFPVDLREGFAQEYIQIMVGRQGLYRVTEVQSHTVLMNGDGILN